MQRIKRLYIIFLCIGLLFGLTVVAKAQIDLSLPDVVGEPGDEQQIAITIADITDDEVMAYQFEIHYDPNIVDITNVSHEGTITPNAPTVNLNPDNHITVAWAGAAPLEGEGTLLYLTIELVDVGNSVLEWQEVGFFAQENATQIEVDMNPIDGSVGVYEQPGVPEPESPENGAVNISVDTTLIWKEVENAYSYNIQVAVDAGFTDIIVDEQGIEDLFLEVEGLAYITEHFWRVQSVNPVGISDWSEQWSFTTMVDIPAPPVLISPADGETGVPTTVTLEWEESDYADTYHIQVAADENFDELTADSGELTETTFELTGLDYDTDYYWRVNAQNVTGTSEWSEVWSFTTIVAAPDVPALVSPEDEGLNIPTTVTLEWEESDDADVYHVQIATDNEFTAIVEEADSLTVLQYEVSDLEHQTTYFWRVRAENVSGLSDWSSIWSFTTIIAVPHQVELEHPADEVVIGTDTVTFSWFSGFPAVTNYTLEIAADAGFDDIIHTDEGVTDTTYKFTDVEDETEYWWRVRAHNEAGAGPFSDARTFEVIITNIDDTITDLPDHYELYQNYPNPFNPSTNIRFSIPERSHVRIEIYNSIGQHIITLVNEELESGNHEIVWNADQVRASSGTYLYRIVAVSTIDPGNKFTRIRSMVLIK